MTLKKLLCAKFTASKFSEKSESAKFLYENQHNETKALKLAHECYLRAVKTLKGPEVGTR